MTDESYKYAEIAQHHEIGYRYWPDRSELRRILAEVADVGGIMLEFGCGRGEQTELLLPKIVERQGRIIATDRNPEMIQRICERFSSGVDRGILLPIIADVFSLFAVLMHTETRLAVIVSSWTMHNFPLNYRKVLFWLSARILMEGGVFVFMDKVPPDDVYERRRLFQQHLEVCNQIEKEDKEAGRAWRMHELGDWSPRSRMLEGETMRLLEETFGSKPTSHARDGADVVISVRRA